MEVDKVHIPIVDIPLEGGVKLSVKREDLVHPQISGNKYWKMFIFYHLSCVVYVSG